MTMGKWDMKEFPKIDIGADLEKMVDIINSKPRNDFVLINRHHLDALISELIKQQPRVMTLEELQKIASIRDGAVWLEAGAGLMPAFMEFATKDITFFVAVPLTGYRQFFENDWYGKSWRCWDKMPTDEQRKAVKWDD